MRLRPFSPLLRNHAFSNRTAASSSFSSSSSVPSIGPQLHFTSADSYATSLLHPAPDAYTQLLVSWAKRCGLSAKPLHLRDETLQWAGKCGVLHARIVRLGFPLAGKLGNALVDLYSKSGHVAYAKKAFGALREPTSLAWNSVLSALSNFSSPEMLVREFLCVHSSGLSPDQFTFAIVLSACARLADAVLGEQVHSAAIKSGFDSAYFCISSAVDMYAKCGKVDNARKVFDETRCPDTVSWTAMIAGYVQANMPEKALELFDRMRSSGNDVPDQVTFVTVISACVNLGRLADARELFSYMSHPNAVAWNAIISGHSQNGHEMEALSFFREMRAVDVSPTRSTLGSVLSAVANLEAIRVGCQTHSVAVKMGLDSNIFVGSSLVSMYGKSSTTDEARKVFDMLDEKNTITWNAMLSGYAQNGEPVDLIDLYFQMKDCEFQCDEFTYVSLLGACSSLENLKLGQQLHSVIVKSNFDMSLFVGNAIVDMYAKLGELNNAMHQLELVSCRDIITWNSVLVGLVYNEYEEKALCMFSKILLDDIMPDEVSFASILSACANLRFREEGQQFHCLSIKFGLETSLYVGSSIINMYGKVRKMEAASKVFTHMPERSVVTGNALIEGYVLNNSPEKALHTFGEMLAEDMVPSKLTFLSILPACNGSYGLNLGRQLHGLTLKSGDIFNDASLGVSLVGMYLRSQNHDASDRLFLEVPYNNSAIFWTALICEQTENSSEDIVFLLFYKMRSYNVHPDQATFVSILKVCADLAALKKGKEVHSFILKTGFYSDESTCSSLLDMYSKCGDINSSHQVFSEMEKKNDIISWNSMLVGYAKNGFAEEALTLFSEMQSLRMQLDEITLLGALTACSHAGLVFKGRDIFDSMLSKYGVKPRYDHYASMIDLLTRGGYLQEAEELIDGMPFEPDGIIWATMLSGCRMHGDSKRGERAAKELIELEPQNSSPYVLLSNLCASSSNWSGVKMVRQAMHEKGVRKSPGSSWITVEGKKNSFVAGDNCHPRAIDICTTLKYLAAVMKDDYLVQCE